MTDSSEPYYDLGFLSLPPVIYSDPITGFKCFSCGRAKPCRHCEEGEDSLVEAVALHREANDSGRRYSLDELAGESGIDLDELRAEIEDEEQR